MVRQERSRATLRQVVRYGVTGVTNNLLGYLIYLAVTWAGMDPKAAITVLYPIGVTTAYFAHRRFVFGSGASGPGGILRYLIAHAIGLFANIVLLYVFSDLLKLPHQAVQAAAIVVVGGLLYLLFRFYVWRARDRGPEIGE
jgi:putative flippase GtrA